jgi:signal transduction histidine kinase
MSEIDKLKDKKKINEKGTGLGLNISRRIVESMGGTINVESEYKKGTKFIIIVNV